MMELVKVDSAMCAKPSQLPYFCFQGSLLLERNPTPTAVLDHREKKTERIHARMSNQSNHPSYRFNCIRQHTAEAVLAFKPNQRN